MSTRSSISAALLCAGGGTAAGLGVAAWRLLLLHYPAHGLVWLSVESAARNAGRTAAVVSLALLALAGLEAAVTRLAGRDPRRAGPWLRWARIGGVAILAFGCLDWATDVWMPEMGRSEHALASALGAATLAVVAGAGVVELARRTMVGAAPRPGLVASGSLVLVLALLGLASLYARSLRPTHGPSVLLVVIDCLRVDHLGAYGYERDTSPTLDALAHRGRRYRQARAPAPWTKASVASLLTGRLPYTTGVVNLADALPPSELTITERLAEAGHDTIFLHGTNGWLGPSFGLPQSFDEQRPDLLGAAIADAFVDWLGDGRKRPFFAYLHFMDAHEPYHVNEFTNLWVDAAGGSDDLMPPSERPGMRGGDGFSVDELRKRTADGTLSEADRKRIVAYYDAQIRYVDHQIARVLARLDDLGLTGRTLVVVTADHGEEFWDHGSYGHGHTLYDELLRVPLVIAGPEVPAAVVDEPTSLVDLMPTLLALMSLESGGPRFDGHVVPGDTGAEPAPTFAMATVYGTERRAVVQDGWKLIRTGEEDLDRFVLHGPDPTRPTELYDLRSDPGERDDRTPDRTPLLDALSRALEQRLPDPTRSFSVEVDDETRRRLEAIGYGQ